MKPRKDPFASYKRPALGIVHGPQEPVNPNRTRTQATVIHQPNLVDNGGHAAPTSLPLEPDPLLNLISSFKTSAVIKHGPAIVHQGLMTKAEIDRGWLLALDEWNPRGEPVQ